MDEKAILYQGKVRNVGDIVITEFGAMERVEAVGDGYLITKDITPWNRRVVNWVRKQVRIMRDDLMLTSYEEERP